LDTIENGKNGTYNFPYSPNITNQWNGFGTRNSSIGKEAIARSYTPATFKSYNGK